MCTRAILFPPAPKWHVMLGCIILQKFSAALYAEEVKRREAKMNVVFRYVPCRIYLIEKDHYILVVVVVSQEVCSIYT